MKTHFCTFVVLILLCLVPPNYSHRPHHKKDKHNHKDPHPNRHSCSPSPSVDPSENDDPSSPSPNSPSPSPGKNRNIPKSPSPKSPSPKSPPPNEDPPPNVDPPPNENPPPNVDPPPNNNPPANNNPPPAKGSEAEQFVAEHNVERALVGAPLVTWNATVAADALKYANERKKDCKMEHSKLPYGENIMSTPFPDAPVSDSVRYWASEKKDYKHGIMTAERFDCCGHYTQVVWKTSTQIGCARVACDPASRAKNGQAIFMTCNYYPGGNGLGVYPY